MRQAGELDSLKGRHWGCMERWPVGKAARGSSFAPLEKGKQTAGQGILKTEQLEGLWSIKTSPCRGILRQLHGHCRQAYHREHASWLFCASAAHLLSAKFGRICSCAGRPSFSKPADTMWGEWAKLTGVFLYHRPFERRFCGMHKARCFKGHREKAARAIPYSLGERWGLCGDYKTCNTRQMSHTKRPHTSLDLCGRLCGAARKPQCVVMQVLRLPQTLDICGWLHWKSCCTREFNSKRVRKGS